MKRVLFILLCFATHRAHADTSVKGPFAKYHGDYIVSKCNGGTDNVSCQYKLLTIASGDHANNGAQVPSVKFRFSGMSSSAMSELLIPRIAGDTYEESGKKTSLMSAGAEDDRDGSRTNQSISLEEEDNGLLKLSFKNEKIPKEGQPTSSEAVLIIKKK